MGFESVICGFSPFPQLLCSLYWLLPVRTDTGLVAVLRVEDRGKGKYLKTHEPAMSGSFSGAAGRPVPCEELH